MTGVAPLPVVALIVKVPVAAPINVGVNTTLMVQLPVADVPAAHVLGVAEDSENGPVKARFVIGSRGFVPSAVTVTVSGALGTFTGIVPKVSDGVTAAVWP